ncbi:MAG: hypothetical protein Kow0065_23670 [Methylomicrobium sp.]
MKQLLTLIFITVAIMVGPAQAGISEGWQRLGKEKVKARMERDEMRLASKGFFRQIALEVQGAAVHFDSISVHFGNGEAIDVPIRSIVRAGERSRVIDLPGEARLIRKIVFIHKKLRDSGKAQVIVWGRK